MQTSHSFIDVVLQYFAEGILLPLAALALVWVYRKWNKDKRQALLAIGVASVLVFNEPMYQLFSAMGEGSTYYRLFWIAPFGLIIAAIVVQGITSLEKRKSILVLVIFLIACYMNTEKTGAEWFDVPDNVYQIEDDVMQVADALMEVTGGNPTYLADDGSIGYTVRQYNAKVMYTDMGQFDMDLILKGYETNVMGRDVQDAIINNHTRFIAIKKSDKMICKIMESAGVKLASKTDNYNLYYVDYNQLGKDWNERDSYNVEYIPVSDIEMPLEYAYITDLGDANNEQVYLEMLDKIGDLALDGIIINSQYSKNFEWVEIYAKQLQSMGVPVYLNNKEFQHISLKEIELCMIDNREQISDETIQALEELSQRSKPVILVLSKQLNAESGNTLLKTILAENSNIVQVLSAEKDVYAKTLLDEKILQYAAPVDSDQVLNIIRIESLETEEIVLY